MFQAAMQEFFRNHWPCEYKDKHGKRCVNVATKHHKGHQLASGKVVRAGEHNTNFPADDVDVGEIFSAYEELSKRSGLSADAVSGMHHEMLAREEYKSIWNEPSNTTCFGCFFSVPSHVLPCRHVLCTTCIEDLLPHGQESWLIIDHCPLCPRGRGPMRLSWRRELRHAPPRVLSLDGYIYRSPSHVRSSAKIKQWRDSGDYTAQDTV